MDDNEGEGEPTVWATTRGGMTVYAVAGLPIEGTDSDDWAFALRRDTGAGSRAWITDGGPAIEVALKEHADPVKAVAAEARWLAVLGGDMVEVARSIRLEAEGIIRQRLRSGLNVDGTDPTTDDTDTALAGALNAEADLAAAAGAWLGA